MSKTKLPAHVAIIMDGNGRWAAKRALPRSLGHRAGSKRIQPIAKKALDMGIQFLSLYCFSTENWNRPADEISFLMKLLEKHMTEERDIMIENQICVKYTGDISKLPKNVQELLEETVEVTKNFKKLILNFCINYSGRSDIVQAVNNLIQKNSKDSVTEESFAKELSTRSFPYPDLVIRTSGEKRISNYMLWECAYSELYFSEKPWPQFEVADFEAAITEYKNRERRFGKISSSDEKATELSRNNHEL